MIYAESVYVDIIKVSSDPNQLNPLETISIHYTLQKFGTQWDVHIYGKEIELSNKKDIRCTLNKKNLLFVNLKPVVSYDGTSSYYAYFVFKLDDSTFAVFDNNMVNKNYVDDIIAWCSKNDVTISHHDWTTNHTLKSGFNGLTYVDYFKDSVNGKKTGIGMKVLAGIVFIIAIEAFVLCKILDKTTLGVILAIIIAIIGFTILRASKAVSNK